MAKKSGNFLSNMSFLRQLLLISFLFFLLSGGIAFYAFFAGGNVISSSNISIKIDAPLSVAGGEKVPVVVTVQNQNNVPLMYADLVLEYPEGARLSNDLSRPLKQYRESLGQLAIGEKVTKQLDATLFGEEGDKKQIKALLEYRIEGSNAIFSKETLHELIINSSPIAVRIDGPTEVSNNGQVELKIKITSNSDSIIKNFVVKAEYPLGFQFQKSSPSPSFGNNFWNLGDLRPGSERTMSIIGLMEGEQGDEKVLRFFAGIGSVDDERQISVTFLEKEKGIFIQKALVDARILFDGGLDTKEHITKVGNRVNVQVSWANNMDTSVNNLVIEAVLKGGDLFDRRSVQVQNGFFRSIDNVVVWDQTSNPVFASIAPKERGSVGFSFNIVNRVNFPNPQMGIEVNVKTATGGILSSTSKSIKISSIMTLNAKLLYASGPLKNTGPVPPQAEKETTYTVTLALGSSLNDLGGVSVRMFLPTYVRWLEKFSPPTEKFTYNMLSGELIWLVGDLKGGTGFSSSPREVSFQVAFLPSISQVGTEPIIVRDIEAQGEDRFTGWQERVNVNLLTTNLANDPLSPVTRGVVRE
jgi:hypothetical protein